MLVGLCQMNPTVGALAANADAIIEAYEQCAVGGAQVAVFGELAVCGYPPEDLVLKRRFLADCRAQVDRIAAASGSCVAIVGFPEAGPEAGPEATGSASGRARFNSATFNSATFNSAAICRNGFVEAVYRKVELPNYDVFDEGRWFEPGEPDQPLFFVDGVAIGVSICEDIWLDDGPPTRQAVAGAELIVNLNGSPFHRGRMSEREDMLQRRSTEMGVPVIYVNQVGGQDDLVFDGGSMVVSARGEVVHRLAQFVTDVRVVDTAMSGSVAPHLDDLEQVWSALVIGTRDYALKNGFTEVVIGLSGGIDSSIVAAIAVDALGSQNVHGVLMPSRYSSDGSITDAELLVANLGIDHRVIAIEPAHGAFTDMLAPSFEGHTADLTEENLQSRLRGVTLMALSNKFGWLVLTTGNKSESAVGYSTLYGDTAGGLAVIKDVYKLVVYELCEWRNARSDGERIPATVLTKAPSAELRPDQRDDQSLPAYEILDPLLEAYIDGDSTEADLIEAGGDPAVVTRICRLVDLAEYKRRQSPPGLRVMRKAFGRDRRLPITNRYR